jgi:hypothetical protein
VQLLGGNPVVVGKIPRKPVAFVVRATVPSTCGNCPYLPELHDFEGTSEIQRMIIGRAVIGLDVR